MNDGRTRPPDQTGQPGFGGPATDPLAPPVTGPLDGAAAAPAPPPAAAPALKPIVVTRPMAAHPAPAPGIGAIVTHRATQMSASVGIPSTLESPKDAPLLRAEAQTRIDRPLGSAIPSTLEDVDSTMPDNAARDAAIRDAARAADERAGAGSQGGSRRFGPPTLQSPNDGSLPSSNAASVGGAVVDAILPSAAFVKPDPPPTAPTHGGPPPIPTAWNRPAAGAGFGAARAVHAPGPPGALGPRGPTVPDDAWPAQGVPAALVQTGGHGSGSGRAYFPGGQPPAGSAAPGAYGASAAPGPAPVSQPPVVPMKKGGAGVAIAVVLALAAVAAVAILVVVYVMRARSGALPGGATNPTSSAVPASGSPKGK